MKENEKTESVYKQICTRLAMFGFVRNINGGMDRDDTGCKFYVENLTSYRSLAEFVQDYECYEITPQLN